MPTLHCAVLPLALSKADVPVCRCNWPQLRYRSPARTAQSQRLLCGQGRRADGKNCSLLSCVPSLDTAKPGQQAKSNDAHIHSVFIQAAMRDQADCPPSKLASLRSELTELRKFVVLNYIAVIKAAKKRNRHLKVSCEL